MENITTEKIINKQEIFQSRFGKVDGFGWWYLDPIQTDASTQFTSKDFQEGLYVRVVQLTLVSPDHMEMNSQVEVTWRTLCTISHSLMVHAQVLDEYIHSVLMYTIHQIFLFIN